MSPNEHDGPDAPRPRGGRRRSDSRRVYRPARWLLLGGAIALVVGFVAVLSFTQTEWGREQVLGYTLITIGGRLNGEVEVARMEGNVITGARLYEIAIRDTAGAPLAIVDSAFVRYRLASFLGGDVVINRLTAYGADVDIFRLPGDTLWNYEGILQDPSPAVTPAEARATLIESITVVDADVTVRQPVRPDVRLSEAAQEAQLAEILGDDRYVIEEVPGGYLQTTAIDVQDAEVRELFIGPDERGGTYLEVVDGVADVYLWRDPPLELRGVQAQVHLQNGVLEFRAAPVVLPNSRGDVLGSVDLTGERPLYDLVIESPTFSLADLRWLYPWLPDDPGEATGSVRLRVEDRAEGLLVFARDFVLEMPGTEVTGDFGMITGPDVLRFVNVDLEAGPLRVESVEQLLPEDLPVEGLVVGGAVIQGAS
ncbi:MAG: hypothetical protein WD766_11995 [Gemmatimonadota bacterium]